MLYLTPGTKIRAFTLTKLLGKGGMSAVWKARHGDTGQDFALKILHGSVADDKSIRQRFFEEGLIQARIAHPNVVGVKGRIEEHPIHALVMEYVDGPSLKSYVEQHAKGLHLTEAKSVTTGVLSGLNASHRRGIIHRDIKPSNVILARDFQTVTPKLTDFGIAKVKLLRARTIRGAPLGTPHFMSPEQLKDSHEVTHLTDIYSLGVTLYFMVTHSYPFDDEDFNQLMVKIKLGDHPPASSLRPGIPKAIDALIERCMSLNPEQRPQNVREVLEIVLGTPWVESQPGDRPASRPAPRLDTFSSAELGEFNLDGPLLDVTPADPAPGADPLWHPGRRGEPAWNAETPGPETNPLDDRVLARSFKRSSWLGQVLVMALLFTAGLVGTLVYLDSRERDSNRITDQGGSAAVVSELRTMPPGSTELSGVPNDGSPPASSRGTQANVPAAVLAAGSSTTGSPIALIDMSQFADNPPGDAVGTAMAATGPVVEQSSRETQAGASVDLRVREQPFSASGAAGQQTPSSDLWDQVREQPFVSSDSTGQLEIPQYTTTGSDSQENARFATPTGREAEREAELAWDRRQQAERTTGPPTVSTTRETTGTTRTRQTGSPSSPDAGSPSTASRATSEQPATETGAASRSGASGLTPLQINGTLRADRARYRTCFQGSMSDPIEMRITIRPDGTVSYAAARTEGADMTIVRCIIQVLSGTRFDSFDGPAMNVFHTFSRIGP